MLRTDGDLLAEFSCLDPLYVDGIAGLVNLGDTFATCFFRWAAAKAEGGLIVQERMPAVYLVRPRASITCSAACQFRRILDAQGKPVVPRMAADMRH